MKFIFVFIVCFFAMTILPGCNDDSITPISPVQNSYLSFTNACPDSPNLDVYIGSNLFAANIGYLQTIRYLTLLTGNNRVLAYTAGTTTNPLFDTTVSLQTNQFYSIFAIDSLQSIKPLFLHDDLTTPGSTNCNARFINLAPGAPAYDVQAVGKSIWFPNYSYGVVSGFRPLSSGLYDIQVKLTGTPTVVVDIPNTSLTQGSIYTFITNGFPGATGAQALGFTIIKNFQNSLSE